MKRTQMILIIIISITLLACGSKNDRINFAPENGVLVFVGQDNESVGGTAQFSNGYIDNIGIPTGITHYIDIMPDSSGEIYGLRKESDWNAGPMCLKYYLESPKLQGRIIHLSISMVGSENKVASGELDKSIAQIADFIQEYKQFPFILRIGYEFDGSWNHYDSTDFKSAFVRIVEHLRDKNITNFATCFAASSPVVPFELWNNYYPGDEYVDWCGYSYWSPIPDSLHAHALDFARAHQKPIFIAELAPRGYDNKIIDGETAWNDWYIPLFEHIDNNSDVIRAISYINCDWNSQKMWQDDALIWGDTRIQVNEILLKNWLKIMQSDKYIHSDSEIYKIIGFEKEN